MAKRFISAYPQYDGAVYLENSKNNVMKCVEEGLVEVLGPSGKDAIAYHLASEATSLADSFDQPVKFVEAIRTIFRGGSNVLEERFAEHISSVFQVDVKGMTFSEIVKRIREPEK